MTDKQYQEVADKVNTDMGLPKGMNYKVDVELVKQVPVHVRIEHYLRTYPPSLTWEKTCL